MGVVGVVTGICLCVNRDTTGSLTSDCLMCKMCSSFLLLRTTASTILCTPIHVFLNVAVVTVLYKNSL